MSIKWKHRFGLEPIPFRIVSRGKGWVKVNSATDATKRYKVIINKHGQPESCECLGWVIKRVNKETQERFHKPCNHMEYITERGL